MASLSQENESSHATGSLCLYTSWITHDRRRYPRQVNYAQLLFPDFSLIACGWLLCRYTALDRRVWDHVESLVYYFLFPVLLFHSIVRSPLDFGATSSLVASGIMLCAVGVGLSYSIPYLPWLRKHIDP